MLKKVQSWFKTDYVTTFTPPISLPFPSFFPARSEWTGIMEAWTCPNCNGVKVHMFANMDSNDLIVTCDDCKLQVRHPDREVIGKLWRGHDIGNCPNCNLPFSQHNLACPDWPEQNRID